MTRFSVWLDSLTEDVAPDTAADFMVTYDTSATTSKKVKLSTLGASANNSFYTYLAASLEPDAIEPLQVDGFSYAVGAAATKLLIASYNTRLGATGRMEVRNPFRPMPLRGVTLNGIAAGASAVLVDPTIPTYTDARTKYYDRLNTLYTSQLLQVDVVAPATNYPFLLGAYGGIVLRAVNFDFDWISVQNRNTVNGFNLANEEQDGAAYSQRNDQPLFLALNKLVATELYAGAERAAGVGRGTVVYVLCPSTWSVVTDATSYDFRDDFMGASLDTATKWTRVQSVVGNVEINTTYQWCKIIGTVVWGQNGAFSQTGVARANGKTFLIDIYTGRNATANNSVIVGFHDGAGQSYSDFSHGLLFTSTGVANQFKVYENGNDRGVVGTGYTAGTIYRVKIVASLTSNNAAYYIQGGAYGALGSASWTNITPAGTSSATTPIYAGFSSGATGTMYLSDARIY